MSLHPDHLIDLKKSGLTDETIEKAGIHSVPPRDFVKILGRGLGDKVESVLAFPYNGNGFCRYKIFPPLKDKDGHKMKYYQAPGSGVHLYLPPGIKAILSNRSMPISICEGEKKALKGYQEGIFTIGLGGVWNFKEGGEDKLINDFDQIPLEGRTVNLIPDGDYHQNEHIQKAILKLAGMLEQRGAIPFLIPLPDGDEKIGLDDFLVRFGISEFWEIPHEKILTDPFQRLNLSSAFDVTRMNVKVEWLVEGLIPKNGNTLLHAIGGVGKTYLVLTLADAVAEGKPFFGLQTLPCPVYYIDFENPISELSERMRKIGNSENLLIWHLNHDPAPVRLDDSGWEIYKSFPPGLFIFDSLRSSHLLEENSSKDASFVMARVKEIRSKGNTIITIHHENKSGGYRGSTAWFDLSDHILKFSRVRAVGSDEDSIDDDFNLPIRLGLGGKSRFSSAMELKPLFFKFEDHRLVLASDPEGEILSKMADLIDPVYPPNQSQLKKLVTDNLGLKRTVFERLLRKGEVGGFWYSKRSKNDNKLEYFKNVF